MVETLKMTDTRKEIIENLYLDFFPSVAMFVRRRGGTIEDAKEVFQEALIALFERKMDASFKMSYNIEAYLMGIIKHLWYQNQNQVKHEAIHLIEIEEECEKKPVAEKLLLFLAHSGQKCMELLQSFYYEKLDLEQVSKRFGFSSDRSAATQKYKCLEKVRNEVKQKSLSYEDFID